MKSDRTLKCALGTGCLDSHVSHVSPSPHLSAQVLSPQCPTTWSCRQVSSPFPSPHMGNKPPFSWGGSQVAATRGSCVPSLPSVPAGDPDMSVGEDHGHVCAPWGISVQQGGNWNDWLEVFRPTLIQVPPTFQHRAKQFLWGLSICQWNGKTDQGPTFSFCSGAEKVCS